MPAIESFTDTNGVELPAHSSSWVYNQPIQGLPNVSKSIINSNALTGSSASVGSLTRYVGSPFSSDHSVAVSTVAVSTVSGAGPAARLDVNGDRNLYVLICYSNASTSYKSIGGVPTALAANHAGFVASNTAFISASSNVITTKNGTTTLFTGTDSAISDGLPGVYTEHVGASTRIDDFVATDLRQVRANISFKATAGSGLDGLQKFVYEVTFFGDDVSQTIAIQRQLEIEVLVANSFTNAVLRAAIVAAAQEKAAMLGLALDEVNVLTLTGATT